LQNPVNAGFLVVLGVDAGIKIRRFGIMQARSKSSRLIPMPHKHNAAIRHHIGKMKFKMTNWREYEESLRRRGSLTLW
jgi:hypothetical protein